MLASSSGGGFAGERCGGVGCVLLAVVGVGVWVALVLGRSWTGSWENLFLVGIGKGSLDLRVLGLAVFFGKEKHSSARFS